MMWQSGGWTDKKRLDGCEYAWFEPTNKFIDICWRLNKNYSVAGWPLHLRQVRLVSGLKLGLACVFCGYRALVGRTSAVAMPSDTDGGSHW